MDVRPEDPSDHSAVRAVHLAAFGDHGPVVAALVDDLRRSVRGDDGLSLVAHDAQEVVGHIMFTRSLLDAPRRLVDVQVLSPLAVRPSHQRRGIGAELVRAGLRTLERRGVPLVFLEGDPRTYEQLGFVSGADHGFRKPSLRIPDAAFQVIALRAHEACMTGTLVYADTFWRNDCVGLRDPGA